MVADCRGLPLLGPLELLCQLLVLHLLPGLLLTTLPVLLSFCFPPDLLLRLFVLCFCLLLLLPLFSHCLFHQLR